MKSIVSIVLINILIAFWTWVYRDLGWTEMEVQTALLVFILSVLVYARIERGRS